MEFKPTYNERNLKNLAQLGDNTKKKAIEWYEYLIDNEIDLLIYETIRTEEQQKTNVAKGASQTMKSYHIVGQALDFVPVNGKETLWSGYGASDVKRAISKAKELGFEWGGDWTSLIDKPHLQFNYKGYGTDTFKTKGENITLEKTVEPAKTEVKAEVVTTPSKKTTYTLPTGTYKKGSKGTAVKQIQTALVALHFYPDKIAKNKGIDSIFGNDTENALKRFQSVYCNPSDGIYGKLTRAALLKQLNN